MNTRSETTDVMLMEKTFTIAVTTQPRKTAYRYHESIDYTNMVVTATYSDQTTAIVTSLCTITPAAGKAYDAEIDETVTISYTEYSTTEETELQLTSVIPTSLLIASNPSTMSYKTGEEISYSGMNVTAILSDGTHDNIQKRNLVIVPADGKAFNPNTDTNVSISYTEGHETVDAYLMFTPITLTQIAVTTQPTKTTYSAGDPISYTGIVVTATYSDSTTEDITSNVTYSVAEGTPFNAVTTSNITITYTNGVETATTNLLLEEEAGDAFTLAITTPPSTTEYAEGTTISLAGMVAVLTAQDGTNSAWNDVADWCISDPAVMPSTDVTAAIKCQPAETPSTYDYNCGWIQNGVWTYENPTQTYTDIYRVTGNHKYSLGLGAVVGSRFRAMFTTVDITQVTSDTVTGTAVVNVNNPSAYAKADDFVTPSDGYILVAKDNVGVSGLHSYLFDLDAVDASKTIETTQQFTVAVGFQTMEIIDVVDSYNVDDEISYENIVVKYNWDQSDNTKYTEIEGETALAALEFSVQEGTIATAAMDGTVVTVTGATEVVPSMAHVADIGVDDYGDFYADYPDAYSYIFPCVSGHTYIVCMGADAANYLVVASFSQNISPGTSDVYGGTVYDIYGRGAHQAVMFDCEDTGEVCATSFDAGAEIHLLDCGNISQAVSDTFTLSVSDDEASYTIDSVNVETDAGYDSWYGNAYTIYKSVTIYYHVGTSGQLMAYFTLGTNQETETDKDDYIIPGSGGEFTYKTWHGCYPVGIVKKGTGLYYNYYHWSEASDPHFAEAWEQYGRGRSMPEYAADCSVDCSLRSKKFASLTG